MYKMYFSVVLGGMLIALAPRAGVKVKDPGSLHAGQKHVPHQAESLRRRAESKAVKARALVQKQTSQDFAAAVALLQESARLFHMGSWNAQAAEAYRQIGEVYFTQGRYDAALHAYREALALTGENQDLRAKIFARMACTAANQGYLTEADDYSKRALRLIEGPAGARTQAEVLEARGETLFWQDNYKHAAEFFVRARDLFAEIKDVDGQALALLMLSESGDADPLQDLRRAVEARRLWSAAKNGYGEARARARLGNISALAGQFETARCNLKIALSTFQQAGDRNNAAGILNTMGFLSIETGDAEKSLAQYNKAQSDYAASGDRLGQAEAITGKGRALTFLQQYSELLPLYQKQLWLAQQAKNKDYEAVAEANLGDVYQRQHQDSRAEQFYQHALDSYRSVSNSRGEGDVLIHLARLYNQEGKTSEAIAALENARPLKEKNEQVEELAKIGYELASLYRKLGRLEEALREIQKTIAIIESQRINVANFDSRASYFASVHSYYALYVQLLMSLSSQNQQESLAMQALEAAEKSKVRSLLDWLSGSSQNAPCKELLEKQEALANFEPTAGSDAKPTRPATEDSATGLSVAQIQAELAGANALILEYALGDEKSYLWVLDGAQISHYELPPAQRFNALIHDYRRAAIARLPVPGETNDVYTARVHKAMADYDRYAARLSQSLLGAISLTGTKPIIIVPEGPLQYVPFAALSVRRGGRMVVVAADHDVITLPSVSALRALRKASANRLPPASLAAIFADPVFEPNDACSQDSKKQAAPAGRSRSVWRSEFGSMCIPRLPSSSDEADAAQTMGSGSKDVFVAKRFLASRRTFLKLNLGTYRFLHFATHGLLNQKHPELSGIILSLVTKEGLPQDGFIGLSDIYKLKLSADVVVLSSCDSGLGKDLSSEGIIGLPRAFLSVGARSVIATLWKVDDEATARLMTHFYRHLHHGENPASALRHAQLALAKDPQWRDPYYWAAFVLQGDYL